LASVAVSCGCCWSKNSFWLTDVDLVLLGLFIPSQLSAEEAYCASVLRQYLFNWLSMYLYTLP
jgi:hypothetical protein